MTEPDTNPRDLILHVFSRVAKGAGGRGCIGLSPAEAAFCRVMWLEASVDTGGFAEFFFDSYGDFASETLEALSRIGAFDAAALLREAIALFGSTGPSRDQVARNEELVGLGPGAAAMLSKLDEAFYSQEEALDLCVLVFLRSAGLVGPDAAV
jgi:Domain of unknown function (DUF4375)